MTTLSLKTTFTALFLMSFLPLAGCNGKLTQENADKIHEGMTLSEVEAILGPGKKTVSDKTEGFATEGYQWGGMGTTIIVIIQNGKVASVTRAGI